MSTREERGNQVIDDGRLSDDAIGNLRGDGFARACQDVPTARGRSSPTERSQEARAVEWRRTTCVQQRMSQNACRKIFVSNARIASRTSQRANDEHSCASIVQTDDGRPRTSVAYAVQKKDAASSAKAHPTLVWELGAYWSANSTRCRTG